MLVSIFMNVGLLVYFKYANFFIENFNFVLQECGVAEIGWTKVALPIGISFYTFQTLTYSIDVYRGSQKPLKHLHNYLLYILSFPQMIAGPIVRFGHIAKQISDRPNSIDDKLFGFYRFCIGLAKKVLIANVLGEVANDYFELSHDQLSTTGAWIGISAYTFQIYFDFAGYSDMAIGLGRMMGFRFPENFNNPYNAASITEFWKRWHMTLSEWMRDYLYIPLGGNRVKQGRLYVNLVLVFLISGLWHGASWNFVIWGAYHGLFLILDRIFLQKLLNRLGKFPSVLITFPLVMIGWVFFGIEDLNHSVHYLGRMFEFKNTLPALPVSAELIFTMTLAAVISFVCLFKFGNRLQLFVYGDKIDAKRSVGITIVSLVLFIICVGYITSSGFNPFIYFRF
ncbi:MAG: MBOAT family protein [Crocinitomicaceae bacterium]